MMNDILSDIRQHAFATLAVACAYIGIGLMDVASVFNDAAFRLVGKCKEGQQ